MPSSRVTSEIRRLSVPAEVGLTIVSASGQSADLTQWQGSTGTVLAKIDSAGLFTLPNVSVTSTTVPANGIYLPAANTLGFATNSAVRMQIDANGNVGVGITPASSIGFYIAKNITGGLDSKSIQISSAVQSDVTTAARIFFSAPSTQATSFTLTTLSHFQTIGATLGAGSTITNQHGFIASAGLMTSGVTNAYAFRGLIASASGAWNTYMDGTAANYFAGQTTVGSTSLTLGSSSAAQQFGVVSTAAANVGIVVRGAASQSNNLQEWQNSAGTVLANIGSGGKYTATGAPDQIAIVSADSSGTSLRFESTATNGRVFRIGHNFVVGSGEFSIYDNTASAERMTISSTGNIGFNNNSYGGGAKVISIANAGTVPSTNPTGGGVLYVEGGALKYRGSSGTVTTIANA